MVWVTIEDMVMRRGLLAIDMVVAGNVQPNPRGVMDFLTRLFSKLEFDCGVCMDPRVATLKYYFDDLAREKVFIGRIPENTYIFLQNTEDVVREAVRLGEDVVDLFVDVGSPFKHVYIVKSYPRGNGSYVFFITGLGYSHGDISIYMELVPREDDDGEIHAEVSQNMWRNKRALLERVLGLYGSPR